MAGIRGIFTLAVHVTRAWKNKTWFGFCPDDCGLMPSLAPASSQETPAKIRPGFPDRFLFLVQKKKKSIKREKTTEMCLEHISGHVKEKVTGNSQCGFTER